MPLPFAVPFGLLVGASLAWLARAELARSEVPPWLSRAFFITLGYALLVVGPVLGYFVAFHGDWAYLFLVSKDRIPSAVDLLLVLFAALHIPLGFALAAPLAAARRSTPLLRVSAALALVLALSAVVLARRLGTSATLAQFRGGFGAVPIAKSALGPGLLTSWVALAAGYAWTATALGRVRRRANPAANPARR